MTEDEIYRTSTQYRLWSFTPESLASLRATTNAAASDGVRTAFQNSKSSANSGEDGEIDCLNVVEEQKIVSYYCLDTLNLVDFCEYPTNVKVSSTIFPTSCTT